MPVTVPRETTLTPLDGVLSRPATKVVVVLAALAGLYCMVFGIPGWQGFIPYRIDLDVYRVGAQVFLDGGDLYGRLPDTQIGVNLPFTYPPLAAVLFVPLTWAPLPVVNVLFTLVTLAALVLVVRVVVAELSALDGRALWWAAVGLASLAVWLGPVHETINFGQVNVILMLLVVADVVLGRGKWWQGSLIGLAMAIKLTPAVFLAYFLMRRDWRALAMGVASALVYTGLGFLFAPGASRQYWTETLSDPGRIGGLAYAFNQSLNGALVRFGLPEDVGRIVWFGACAVLGLSLLWLLHRLFARGEDLWAMVVMGMYALLASPVSWSHHWVWVAPGLLLAAGVAMRVGGALRAWCWTLVGLGLLIFYGRLIWLVPRENDLELQWTPVQHLLGNSQTIWALLFVATAWALALRKPGLRPGVGQENNNSGVVDR